MKKFIVISMLFWITIQMDAEDTASPDYQGRDGIVGGSEKNPKKYTVAFTKKDETTFRIFAKAATGWTIIGGKITSSNRWIAGFSKDAVWAFTEPVDDLKHCPELFSVMLEGRIQDDTPLVPGPVPKQDHFYEIEAHSYMYWIEPDERTVSSASISDNFFKSVRCTDGLNSAPLPSNWTLIPYAGGKEVSISNVDTITSGANSSNDALKSLPPGKYRVLAEDAKPPKDPQGNEIGNQKDEAILNIISFNISVPRPGLGDLDNGEGNGVCPNEPGMVEPDGIYVLVNWDDDDADGKINTQGDGWASLPIPDLLEASVENEDNLVGLKLTIEPLISNAIVELSVSGEKDLIKLWKKPTKEIELRLVNGRKTWDLSKESEFEDFRNTIRDCVFIEGVKASATEKSSSITLSYKSLSDGSVLTISRPLTVLMSSVGAIVYREDEIKESKNIGHGGIITRFKGGIGKDGILSAKNYELTTMRMKPEKCIVCTWGEFHIADLEYWGEFEAPSISFVDRLKIMLAAKYVKNNLPDVKSSQEHALKPFNWSGKLSEISSLSNDGLIEVCHEWNGIDGWGRISNGKANYSILTNQVEHNKSNEGMKKWNEYLFPATQCGLNSEYKGKLWDTTFVKSNFFKPAIGDIKW